MHGQSNLAPEWFVVILELFDKFSFRQEPSKD